MTDWVDSVVKAHCGKRDAATHYSHCLLGAERFSYEFGFYNQSTLHMIHRSSPAEKDTHRWKKTPQAQLLSL